MREFDLGRYGKSAISVGAGSKFDLGLGEYVVSVERDGFADLYAYANVVRSRTLNVVFHGAVRPGIDTYPRFDRIATLGQNGEAFLSFADPTLMISDEVSLAWYLGNRDWDPVEDIVALIRAVSASSGATEVNLIGGSGGGFAAMRVGAQLDDCLVFVFNPQTVIANYNKRLVEKYMTAAFPGEVAEEVFAADPERFDMREVYAAPGGARRLFYLQHLGDGSHVVGHYRPFKRSLGVLEVDGDDASGRVRHLLVDSERDGHGPPRPREFEKHFASALRWSRSLVSGGPEV